MNHASVAAAQISSALLPPNALHRRAVSGIHPLQVFNLTLLALTFGVIGSASANATTLVVTNLLDGGAGSLRQAIANAASGDAITFAPGLSAAQISLASTLTLTKNLTIDGAALALPISISGDSNGDGIGDVRVFVVNSGVTATLHRLDIRRGSVPFDQSGAGIFNSGTLAVTNCAFSNNHAGSNGGTIYNGGGGELTIANSTITGGSAVRGGGIYNDSSSTLTVTNSALSSNQASWGGGIFNANFGTVALTNSTLSGNLAVVNGGGIENHQTLIVSNSTFSANFAGQGGGIYNAGNPLFISNSTLASNTANGNGGGIFNTFGSANVYNTTIVFNVADADADSVGSGAGVYSDSVGTFNLRNSVVAGNSVGGAPIYNDCTGTIGIYGSNRFSNTDGCTAAPGSPGSAFFIGSLAELSGLANHGGPTQTVALVPPSNLIDGGVVCTDQNGNPLATDQRGQPRNVGAACDIGAFEYALDPVFASSFE